jgi:ATP-dependent DNA helicase RecG
MREPVSSIRTKIVQNHFKGLHRKAKQLMLPAMRPSVLDPFFASVRSLSGIGPKVAALLGKLLGTDVPGAEPRVGQLLFLPPHSVIDRRNRRLR